MDTSTPISVKALMERWPSFSILADDVGQGYETVRAWAKRGSIPVIYWAAVIVASSRRGIPGVTADFLMHLHTPAPHPTPANDDTAPVSEDAA